MRFSIQPRARNKNTEWVLYNRDDWPTRIHLASNDDGEYDGRFSFYFPVDIHTSGGFWANFELSLDELHALHVAVEAKLVEAANETFQDDARPS